MRQNIRPHLCILFIVIRNSILAILSISIQSATAADTAYVAGRSYFDEKQYIEYIAGNMPLVISVPHGGHLEPGEITNRELGTQGHYDTNTQELARAIVDAVYQRTGKYPHCVINRLHRSKLDANREEFDAAQDDPLALGAFRKFHEFIDSAESSAWKSFGYGLYIDLHGHRHTIQRLELGYLLVGLQLKLPNDSLNARKHLSGSSVESLAVQQHMPLAEAVRGPKSIGALFERRGIPAVPSPRQPDPQGAPYFSGGYNLERHTAAGGGLLGGLQIETYVDGIRDSEKNWKAFAGITADVLIEYLGEYRRRVSDHSNK
ncbi:MAG: hypothetical protein NTV54_00650 [Ignavibacteriales bacterium]|nr:hypothetical protein [Ignavibacteriales bacterium]